MCSTTMQVSAKSYCPFPNFAFKYLREDETFRETVFACSYGAQVQENGRKSCDTVPVCGLSLLLEVISSFVHRNRYCYIYKHFHKQSSFYIIFVCAFYSVEDTISSSSNWRELLS